MTLLSRTPIYLALLTSLCISSWASLAAEKKALKYQDPQVYMQIHVRTPEQLSAFYLGRQFNQAAIDRILATCLITPIIKNKAYDVLWLELDNWQFSTDDGPIQRIKRDYWKKQWQEVGLPPAHQATFGWTLMPESRDLRIDEGVGGSVVIPMQAKPFTLTAHFKTGKDKTGKPKTIVFKEVSCIQNKK
jgi:hypothetical protein